MPINALSTLTTAALSLSNLILATPQSDVGYQPQSADGSEATQPPTILFHYEGEQTVALESDITDHFIEDNTAIADQISLKPEMITTNGYIGELNNVTPKALALLKKIADKFTVVSAYTPGLSTTALLAYNNAFQLYQTAQNAGNAAVSAWSTITGNPQKPNQTKQQIAFQQFYGYWRARTLFTVQTPWGVFKNTAIKSLRAIQDAETRMVTDFEVTFKLLRFASTETALTSTPILQGRSGIQAASLVDLGTSTPQPSIGVGEGLSNMGVA